eukprot:TRINITY_DN23808_c0_g1_i1.p1 TRINITY_DN23808_c0_g1~~TRINITY_DN23808_c0_g1_i1.p1  ORF type:complete len:321 (+),score=45.06 TRINITY_DN23808_c0_g1_i1:167-1129(+)
MGCCSSADTTFNTLPYGNRESDNSSKEEGSLEQTDSIDIFPKDLQELITCLRIDLIQARVTECAFYFWGEREESPGAELGEYHLLPVVGAGNPLRFTIFPHESLLDSASGDVHEFCTRCYRFCVGDSQHELLDYYRLQLHTRRALNVRHISHIICTECAQSQKTPQVSPRAHESRKSTDTIELPELKALVVDDDQICGRLMHRALKSVFSACAVTVCLSAEEALTCLKSEENRGAPFHLVITDVVMPGMSGIDLFRAARSALRFTPRFIGTSGFIEFREACTTAGMDAFLPKPVSRIDLFTLLPELRPEINDTASHIAAR